MQSMGMLDPHQGCSCGMQINDEALKCGVSQRHSCVFHPNEVHNIPGLRAIRRQGDAWDDVQKFGRTRERRVH